MTEVATDYIFSVADEPFCVWGWNLAEQNKEFISQITPDYFEYFCRTHIERADDDSEQYAALAIRSAYHLALESLFSLIGATLQAPHCVPGWILKASTANLRALVDGLLRGQMRFPVQWQPIREVYGFDDVAKLIFQYSSWVSNENDTTTRDFASLWRRLAHDFVDENSIKEYNSIKHGFRAKPGGFSIRVGVERVPGQACPPAEMRDMGGSRFGTSFYIAEAIGDGSRKSDPNFRLRRRALNWLPENTANRLLLAVLSLKNVKSFLEISAGAKPGTVQFHRLQDSAEYLMPWSSSPGVISSSFDLDLRESHIQRRTRNELLEAIRNQLRNVDDSEGD